MAQDGNNADQGADAALVYIVDDDEAVRDSIGLLLDTVDIAHQAFADAPAFLAAIEDKPPNGVLVLDIRMPNMSGLELQDLLVERSVTVPIVFITGHGDIPMAVEAMRKGAVDFLRKPFRDQELLDRINEAIAIDERDRDLTERLAEGRAKIESLTPREHEVYERVAHGQANKVIAIDLGVSERTVEIHRSQVMKKAGCRSLADLVRLSVLLETAEQSAP